MGLVFDCGKFVANIRQNNQLVIIVRAVNVLVKFCIFISYRIENNANRTFDGKFNDADYSMA